MHLFIFWVLLEILTPTPIHICEELLQKKKNDDKTKWCHYDKINDSIDDDNNVVIIWINLFAVQVKYFSLNHA